MSGDLFGDDPPRCPVHKGPLPCIHCLHRRHDPDTSKAAAHKAPSLVTRHEGMILEALASMPAGGTKDELEAATGLPAVAVARRMRKLADGGSVSDSGERRATPAGRAAIVWEAT